MSFFRHYDQNKKEASDCYRMPDHSSQSAYSC
jgi:hypothetical protein